MIFDYLFTHIKDIAMIVALGGGIFLFVRGLFRSEDDKNPLMKVKIPKLPEIVLTTNLTYIFFGIILISLPIVGPALLIDVPSRAVAGFTPPPPEGKVEQVNKIEEPNYDAFVIKKKMMILDLRSRVPIPKDKLNEKFSFVKLLTTFRVIKKKKTDSISFNYATTGIDLSSRCLTHPQKWKKAEKADVHGDKILKTSWKMIVDVSKAPLDKEFDIVTEVTYWNGFRGEKADWFSTHTTKEIKALALTILFPFDKPFKDHKLSGYKHGSKEKAIFTDLSRFVPSEDKLNLYWEILDPFPDFAYQIDWTW